MFELLALQHDVPSPRVVLLKVSNLFTGEVTRTEALLVSAFSQAK